MGANDKAGCLSLFCIVIVSFKIARKERHNNKAIILLLSTDEAPQLDTEEEHQDNTRKKINQRMAMGLNLWFLVIKSEAGLK